MEVEEFVGGDLGEVTRSGRRLLYPVVDGELFQCFIQGLISNFYFI